MYTETFSQFKKQLGQLDKWLGMAADYAKARNFDADVFATLRLAPDQFPLARQVQIATDFAKGTVARLAGQEPPKYEDNETSVEQLKARIAKTIAFIKEFKPAQIDGSEERDITMVLGGQPRNFKGENYLVGFSLPNFYFHVTTAYAILRHNGVELGKGDYMRPPG